MTKPTWEYDAADEFVYSAADDEVLADLAECPDAAKNGPMMAAAPDMLEALRGLLEIAKLAMPDTYLKTDSRVLAAQAAIEKANGGSNE